MTVSTTKPILCAGETNTAIATLQRAIREARGEISTLGMQYTNERRVNLRRCRDMQLLSHFFSSVHLHNVETELNEVETGIQRIKTLEGRITRLEARITTVPAEIRDGTIAGLMATTATRPLAHFPPLVHLIASYLP